MSRHDPFVSHVQVVTRGDDIIAPAWTDGHTVYIDGLTRWAQDERELLILHERSHIWLKHKERFGKPQYPELMKLAQEMELARVIYTTTENALVNNPKTQLYGGVWAGTHADCPFTHQDDIYDWLIENAHEIGEPICTCGHCTQQGPEYEITNNSEEEINGIINAAKKAAGIFRGAMRGGDTMISAATVKLPPPTLTSELDAIMRHRIVRESSYARPSRRERPEYIDKGRKSISRPPLVEVYVDCSGSFTPDKTKNAMDCLEKILRSYRGSISRDVFFFSNGSVRTKPYYGGDTPYTVVARTIERSNPATAIILTDDDNCEPYNFTNITTKIIVVPISCMKTLLAFAWNGITIVEVIT